MREFKKDVAFGGDRDRVDLRIKMYDAIPFVTVKDVAVTLVRLRGSPISGQHRELMITLITGVLVRVSRNNAADTFQIGAGEGGGHNVMNTLLEHRPVGNVTCRSALAAFGRVYRQWPRYDQADCQTFAKAIYKELCPEDGNEMLNADDDFM